MPQDWTFFIINLHIHDAVSITWEKKHSALLSLFVEKDMVLGGDARCDSMGHCAKYVSYTLIELDVNKVLTVQLVQVGNSQKLSQYSF